MGITVVLENMMLTQLADEGHERWPEIWSDDQSRIRILMLCLRKERPLLEVHGDMIDHDHPVFGLFFRPRNTAKLLKEQDFDPRSASFQFLDIATTDLGKWVQHLITNDGWVRSMTEILPVPMHLRIGLTRAFEGYSIPCFRHPDLPPLGRLHLPMQAESLVGKAFVSIPRLGAEELATRRGAELLVKAGSVSSISETKIHSPVADNVPIPQAKSKTDDTPPLPAIPAAQVSTIPDSHQPDAPELTPAIADFPESQDDSVRRDETAIEDDDGFSEELLASVTHSAGRGRIREEMSSQPYERDENDSSSPDSTDMNLTRTEENDAEGSDSEGDGGDSEERTIESAAEDESTEIELLFPELDAEFKGSGHTGDKSTTKISPPPSPPSPTRPPNGPPSGPTSPPSPPSPTRPPSGPPSGPTSPPSPPDRPPTSPPESDESPIGEFRKVVAGLLADGVTATDIMDNPEFQKVSEVATAAGADTWSIFLEISGAA